MPEKQTVAAAKSDNESSNKNKGSAKAAAQVNDMDAPQDNVYHQILPDEYEEAIPDPQVLPMHLNFNFMEREFIPLHNEKWSKTNEDIKRQTEVITKGFFDKKLPTPSHVILNHINSWETYYPQQLPKPREEDHKQESQPQ